ncbi:hypothetical protein RDV64_21355 [Acuticoccus sp. MNP-M23]|uniref:hypothetical protein n=1 Tax=Acuticoccus sp. MNP-M23 TaxID=3072793 RepID=UPI00281626B9|nr:hypothetical protein [Acuticoccus sp. MNP-M23]WMS42579.1 hypothetical protein RDV64_21355 [Acuticoccus sp. MNP-M23]
MTDRLAIVLDRLLPGDSARGWPAAGALGLATAVRSLADERGKAAELAASLASLPADFDILPEPRQTDALRQLELAEADAFAQLLVLAYGAYYTDVRVRRVVETRTAYPARPPQPEGYALPPFDEKLIETVRQRAPYWRRTGP